MGSNMERFLLIYRVTSLCLFICLLPVVSATKSTIFKVSKSPSSPSTTTTTTVTTTATTTLRSALAMDVDDVSNMAAMPNDQKEDNPEFSAETFVTILVTVMIVLSNCAIIMVAAWTDAFTNFNKTFIYSLTLADLLVGLFITPYSVFLSVYREWVFASDLFCSVEAYGFTTLCIAKMYSLTWLSVDHYVAVRKPERYNVMMSPARSLCWIAFSWVVAISFCCPPLFSFESAIFNNATFICLIDSKQQVAYMLTAGVLASLPSLIALVITNAYLFTNTFKQRIQFYEKVFIELSSRPRNYHITFVMCAVYTAVWAPFVALFFISQVLHKEVNAALQFSMFWIGVSTSCSQFFVFLLLSTEFRQALWEICQFGGSCNICFGGSAPEVVDVNVITLPKKQKR